MSERMKRSQVVSGQALCGPLAAFGIAAARCLAAVLAAPESRLA